MSRYKSPQTAARRAGRDAIQADALRKDRRNMLLKLVGILALMIVAAVAYFIWFESQVRNRIAHRRQTAQHTDQITDLHHQTTPSR